MNPWEDRLRKKLEEREVIGLLRNTGQRNPGLADFISNDYLSLGSLAPAHEGERPPSGSGASRLVSGNSALLDRLEEFCREFFGAGAALFFPSGYMANLGLLSCLPDRHDTLVYDAHCHVSLKEGMRLSPARKVAFRHNDAGDLLRILNRLQGPAWVVTEAIFSMEGDTCPLGEIAEVCSRTGTPLILDEAHSTGVLGPGGRGLAAAGQSGTAAIRIHTFGKAAGIMGAAVVGSPLLRTWLVNHSFPFIYSTAPSPLLAGAVTDQLLRMAEAHEGRATLRSRIGTWLEAGRNSPLPVSQNAGSPVQYIRVPDNETAARLVRHLQNNGFQTKAMLSPTVPAGSERIRITLHAHNTESEIQGLIAALRDF